MMKGVANLFDKVLRNTANKYKNDVEKIYESFKNDYYIDKEMIYDAINNKTMFNIISLRNIVKIDFIIKKNEEYRILEFNRRKKIFMKN